MDRLIALDQKVFAIRASLTALRKERNALASSLGKAIVRMRRRVMSQYRDPDLKQLGLQSPKVWKANPLVRQADLIEEVFAREDVETLLGEPFYDDPFDAAKTVAPVKRVNRDLGSVLEAIDDGLRHSDELFIERDEVKKEHDVLFTYTASTFESFCRLAGLDKLAERVRPSKKRPGRFARQDDGESPADDAGDSEALTQAVPDLEEHGLGSPEPAGRNDDASWEMSADSESKATWSGASSRRATGAPPFYAEGDLNLIAEPDRDRRGTVDVSDRAPTASRSSPTAASSDVTTASGASTRLSFPPGRSP